MSERIEQPIDEGSRFVRNVFSAYGFRLVYGLTVLLLTPYLFRKLGASGFGTYSVILTLAIVYSVLESAFANGLAKLVAELRGQDRRRELNETVAVGLLLATGLGITALVASLALAQFAQGLAVPTDRESFRIGVVLMGAVMLVRLPCMTYGAALMGYQRYDLFYLARLVAAGGLGLGTVLAVEAGFGLLGATAAVTAYLLAEALLWAVLLKRMDPLLPLRPRVASSAKRRRVASFSSYVLLTDSMLFLGQQIDTVVIAAIRGATAAAPFAVAVKLQSAVQSLILPFVDLLMPMTSELWARGEHDEVVRRLALASRAVLQLTLPIVAALALFAEDFVAVWLGPSAPSATADIIVILMGVQIVTLTATPAARVLVGIGRVRVIGLMAAIEGVASFALTVLLVSLYGAVGAATGTLIATSVVAPLMIPIACRAANAPLASFLRESFLPALTSSLPGLVAMLLPWSLLAPGLPRLCAGTALALGISLVIAAGQIGPGRIWLALTRLIGGGRVAVEAH